MSNVNLTTKTFVPPEPVFKRTGQQMSGPDNWSGQSVQHESEGWGSSPPQVETYFVPKTWTLSREQPFVGRKWMLYAHS